MSRVLSSIVRALRRLLAQLFALIPAPPSGKGPAPDIDGHRSDTADTTAIELDILRKDGHGGYR